MLTSTLRVSGAAIAGILIGYVSGVSTRTSGIAPQRSNTIEKDTPSDRVSRDLDTRERNPESGSVQPAPSAVSRAEVEAVMNGLKNIPSMDERRRKFGELMRAWAESDGKAALAFALELPGSMGYLKADVITAAARAVAAQDPGYLKRLIAGMPQDAIRQALVLELVRERAKVDLVQTLAWVEALPQDRGRNEGLRLLRSQLARQSPEEAAKVLEHMPAGFARQNLAGVIATEWGFRDPQTAAQWATSLSAPERESAIPALVASWSQADPQAAGAFVADLPAGEMQEKAAMSVMANWANQSPEAAAGWAMKFPEGRLRDMSVREVVNSWTYWDSNRAFEWIKQMPSGDTRDVALRGYAESVGYWSPQEAVSITNQIQDQIQREASIESVVRSWSEVDAEAAKNWLAKQSFRIGLQNRLSALFGPASN